MTEWPVPSSACGPVGSTRFCLRQRDLARPLRDRTPLSAEPDRAAAGQDGVSGKLPDHAAAACRIAVGNNPCRLPLRDPDRGLCGAVCSPRLHHGVRRDNRYGQVRASTNTEGRASRDHLPSAAQNRPPPATCRPGSRYGCGCRPTSGDKSSIGSNSPFATAQRTSCSIRSTSLLGWRPWCLAQDSTSPASMACSPRTVNCGSTSCRGTNPRRKHPTNHWHP